MKKPEKEEEEENIIIENVKEKVDKKDNGGETLEDKITEIKEDLKEKVEDVKKEIPQTIELYKDEIVDQFREENIKKTGEDIVQKGPCQKCQCIIF